MISSFDSVVAVYVGLPCKSFSILDFMQVHSLNVHNLISRKIYYMFGGIEDK